MAFGTKDEARAVTQQSRAKRGLAELSDLGKQLALQPWEQLVQGNQITAYVSMSSEPPTSEMLDAITSTGIDVWVPIMKKGRALEWGKFGNNLAVNSFGVAEPPADETFDLATVDAIVIPAQRAGLDGTRLGRGAGYYDRALAKIPAHSAGGPQRIVVVFDDEVDDSVPHDSWDELMDVIVTPTRVINLKK